MISKTLAFFALLSATLTASSVIRAPSPLSLSPSISKGPTSDSIFPPTIVFTTCVNENLDENPDDCVDWGVANIRRAAPADTPPLSCSPLDEIINSGINLAKDVSSVAVRDTSTTCTLYTTENCTGGRKLFLTFENGTINALSAFGFDNVANSFNCIGV
ncbi:hypothetical protein C8F04DRAFT_554853 [Mycena alexandri]|uniref:Uncharacterized protein n=1 Tax=Mycena alexandri TaxID=1745969 RepID=A0AAD6SXW5_9AGAR|nr:hypothetical protein C8F04DRAFT_554853 [Mycena alexandri]